MFDDTIIYMSDGKHIIAVNYDDTCENPRDWYYEHNYGWHFVCAKHRYHSLPHEENDEMTLEEMLQSDDYQVVPLFFFEHGNTCLHTGGSWCQWDDCECGYAWTCDSNATMESLQAELNMFNNWANGNCFCCSMLDYDGNYVDDSMSGFIADDYKEVIKQYVEYCSTGFDVAHMEEIKPKYKMYF